jgi:sugar phosphate isomerase/epimerase
MKRSTFLWQIAVGTTAIPQLLKPTPPKTWFEISLAEWSLHKAIYAHQISHLDFPIIAKKEFGISIVEYVNTCFLSKTKDFRANGQDPVFLKELKMRCDDNGISSHLIMCDAEGDLASPDANLRQKAVENHQKWLEAAKYLGCASIRVNANGSGTPPEMAKYAVEGIGKLTENAAKLGLNVLIENHGGNSSNAAWLVGVIQQINLPNVGTLPDWINFCVVQNKQLPSGCEQEYDRYQGMIELLPYAKGVSAHSVSFDAEGNETKLDFKKLMQVVKESGFRGILGIEFSSKDISEYEGIRLTKRLLEKYA